MDWTAILTGALLGVILLSIAYDIVLFVAMRRDFLVWHAVRALAIASAMVIALQLPLPGLFDAIQVRSVLERVAIDIAIGVAGPLLVALVEPRKMSSRVTWLLKWSFPAVLATTFIKLGFDPVPRSLDFIRDLVMLGLVALLITALSQATLRGSRAARYQLAAWAMIFGVSLATLYHGLAYQSVLPDWERWIGFALAIEAVITAAGVADRFMVLARERDAAFDREQSALVEANTDPLTGLPNRRAFCQRFDDPAFARPSGIVILDIDHFKRVNDRFGHDVGDKVLRAVASVLTGDGRFAARLGGEEFALLFYGNAWAREAEEVRRTISIVAKRDVPELLFPVTASAGLAKVEPGLSLSRAMRRADRALYAAKTAGRNRSLALTEFDRDIEEMSFRAA